MDRAICRFLGVNFESVGKRCGESIFKSQVWFLREQKYLEQHEARARARESDCRENDETRNPTHFVQSCKFRQPLGRALSRALITTALLTISTRDLRRWSEQKELYRSIDRIYHSYIILALSSWLKEKALLRLPDIFCDNARDNKEEDTQNFTLSSFFIRIPSLSLSLYTLILFFLSSYLNVYFSEPRQSRFRTATR